MHPWHPVTIIASIYIVLIFLKNSQMYMYICRIRDWMHAFYLYVSPPKGFSGAFIKSTPPPPPVIVITRCVYLAVCVSGAITPRQTVALHAFLLIHD